MLKKGINLSERYYRL